MSFTGPLEDRIAIQELNASYADATTRHDLDAFAGLWMPDAVWVHPALGEFSGLTAIRAATEAAFRAYPMVLLRATMAWLAAENSPATGSVYIDEVVTDSAGASYRAYGQYDDSYVRDRGRWLFKRRSYRLLFRD